MTSKEEEKIIRLEKEKAHEEEKAYHEERWAKEEDVNSLNWLVMDELNR